MGGPRGRGRRGAGREGQGGESVSLTEGVRIIEMKTWERKRRASECEKCCEAGERSEGRHGLCAGGWEGQTGGGGSRHRDGRGKWGPTESEMEKSFVLDSLPLLCFPRCLSLS